MILNGEKLPGLLMTIIRFVLPLQDHTIKKLLLVFWEIVPKTTPDGKLLQEMILVCDAYRKVSALHGTRSKLSVIDQGAVSHFVYVIVFRIFSTLTSLSAAPHCASCAS